MQCVRACVRACACVCARVCVRVCARARRWCLWLAARVNGSLSMLKNRSRWQKYTRVTSVQSVLLSWTLPVKAATAAHSVKLLLWSYSARLVHSCTPVEVSSLDSLASKKHAQFNFQTIFHWLNKVSVMLICMMCTQHVWLWWWYTCLLCSSRARVSAASILVYISPYSRRFCVILRGPQIPHSPIQSPSFCPKWAVLTFLSPPSLYRMSLIPQQPFLKLSQLTYP
jgi:hypothetical protein